MLYIPKIGDYLKILSDDEVKVFVVINFSKWFKSTREKLYPEPSAEQYLIKVAKWLYLFLTRPDEVEKYAKIMLSNSSDKYIHCYNIENSNLFYTD